MAGRRGVPAHEKLLSPPVPQPLNVFLEKKTVKSGFLKKTQKRSDYSTDQFGLI